MKFKAKMYERNEGRAKWHHDYDFEAEDSLEATTKAFQHEKETGFIYLLLEVRL